ncbi:Hypothetical protein SMAX5B_002825, partial [Scophthalmus maximus]
KKTYSTQCLDGKTITVDGSSIGPTSKYKDYKQLVCQACGVKRCTDTTLFKGYSKKDDHGRVIFGNLNRLALKSYGSEDKEISYKCPSGENVQTLKDCLIDTKASTVNKLKKALEAVKRVATSERGKGLASAVGAAVINNRETISKLAKVIGVPEDKVATVDQILKVGNGFYMNDVDGGLKALAELTGHPLSEGEERAIERDMRSDEEVDYGKILALLKRKSDAVADGIDLHRDNQDSFWARYGLYVALSAVALVLSQVQLKFTADRG